MLPIVSQLSSEAITKEHEFESTQNNAMIAESTYLLDSIWGWFLQDFDDYDSVGSEFESQFDGDECSKISALTDRDPTLRRTKQLLDYARNLEAAKKKAVRARKVRFAQIPEDRDCNSKENAGIDEDRVGPPQMIFVARDDAESDEETDDDSRNSQEFVASSKKPSGGSASRINEAIARRKELHRRIALLRIKAAKVRMANEAHA